MAKVVQVGKQAGFTIVELMIATLVFSVVMLLLTTGIIQIGRTYYKGVTSTRTQQAARNIIDEVANDVRFSGGKSQALTKTVNTPSGTIAGYCLGGQLYSYLLDKQVVDNTPTGSQARHALVVETVTNCDPVNTSPVDFVSTPTLTSSQRELVPQKMRLVDFTVTPGTPLTVTVTVVSGEDDLLAAGHRQCIGGAGQEFCSVSTLTTAVTTKVGVQ